MMWFRSKAFSLIFVLFLAFKLACTAPIGESALAEGERISDAAETGTPSASMAEDFMRVENSLKSLARTEDDFIPAKEAHHVQDGTTKSPSGSGYLHKLKLFMKNILKGITPRCFKLQSVLTETKAIQCDIVAWKALGFGEVFLADRYTQKAKELYQKAFELKAKDIKRGDYPKDVLKEYPKYLTALKELRQVRRNYTGLLTFEELKEKALALEAKRLERLSRWNQSKTESTKSTKTFKKLSSSKSKKRVIDTELQALKEENAFMTNILIKDYMGAYQRLRRAESLHSQAEKYHQAVKGMDMAQINPKDIEKYKTQSHKRTDPLVGQLTYWHGHPMESHNLPEQEISAQMPCVPALPDEQSMCTAIEIAEE